jgi:glycosyltransferase involved in cell wall biosynthesis
MLAHSDEVWVITRSNNRSVIEADPLSHASGLHFIYYDLSRWALRLKKQSWFRPVYVVLWQWGAYRLVAKQHRKTPFDAVYHVTFANMKFGSFMGRLAIPFIIGPIAGGERAPLRLRSGMPIRGRISELLRDLGIVLQRHNPLAQSAFAAAQRIYVTTPDSSRLISPKWRSKTVAHLAIASRDRALSEVATRPPNSAHFVFAGRLLHWKGAHFAIRALAEAMKTIPAATLTFMGSGPDEEWLRKLAKIFGVADEVKFAGHIPRELLRRAFHGYTALVFPSLHDSGGLVVLEALAEGLPIVCLDLGGPGAIVNSSCGIVVSTADIGEAQAVTGIAKAMVSLASMSPEESSLLSAGAIARANELSWAKLTERVALC